MLNTKMIETEENISKHQTEHNFYINEHNLTVENLKEELNFCKTEQLRLRSEFEALYDDNKAATEMAQQCFANFHDENCQERAQNNELITGLEKRLTVMQMEKDSIFQLWQMALKAIDVLEDELKSCQNDGRSNKFYEEEVIKVKESYSEAILALESKLIEAKENIFRHQSLWQSSKEKVEQLSKERDELSQKISTHQQESQEKNESLKRILESTKTELVNCQSELERVNNVRKKLEEKLNEAQKFAINAIAKDNEAKCKVSEAIELVESAVREKEFTLQRESQVLEEKLKLEHRLENIVKENASLLEKEIAKIKESYLSNTKKYDLEIEELKLELRQKATLLDRTQRECRLVEVELEKVHQDSESILQKSNVKISDLEQKLKETEFNLQKCEEVSQMKCREKCQALEQQVRQMEERLLNSSETMRRLNLQSSKDVEDRIKEADERTKEAVQRYANLERRLTRTLDDREKMALELQTLQAAFERETEKRDHERKLLETKIRDLQEDLRMATSSVDKTTAHGNMLAGQISSLENEIKRRNDDKIMRNESFLNNNIQVEMKKLQEKFDRKIKELTHHVEVHQKLSKKWKDEAKLLTTKFQKRSKELRNKIIALRNENEELNRELLSCRQQLAQYRVQIVNQ